MSKLVDKMLDHPLASILLVYAVGGTVTNMIKAITGHCNKHTIVLGNKEEA